jgi:hypothetical protein
MYAYVIVKKCIPRDCGVLTRFQPSQVCLYERVDVHLRRRLIFLTDFIRIICLGMYPS